MMPQIIPTDALSKRFFDKNHPFLFENSPLCLVLTKITL